MGRNPARSRSGNGSAAPESVRRASVRASEACEMRLTRLSSRSCRVCGDERVWELGTNEACVPTFKRVGKKIKKENFMSG